jgi:hypothetical protein
MWPNVARPIRPKFSGRNETCKERSILARTGNLQQPHDAIACPALVSRLGGLCRDARQDRGQARE